MLTSNQEQFIYWIIERDHIRQLKEAGEPTPWSNNIVMQKTYFCNVDREDDRVTKWIRQNWTYNKAPDYYDFAMVVARIFNLPSTLSEVGQPIETWEWLDNAKKILHTKRDRGDNIWNGAYLITTNKHKINKVDYYLNVLRIVAEDPCITDVCETLEEAHQEIMNIGSLGSFLAAQVVADLKNTDGHPLENAPDWWSFSAHGVGSLKGLTLFWEEQVTKHTYQEKIQEAYHLIKDKIPQHILDIMCMQNFQNCFCEYDKFMRVTNNTGRSKRKYNGRGE